MAKDLDYGFDPTLCAVADEYASVAARNEGWHDDFAAFDLEFDNDPFVRGIENRADAQELIELSLHMAD